jgi:hypothetical protein
MVTDRRELCKMMVFDIICASELNCNKRVSMQQTAYLTWLKFMCVLYIHNKQMKPNAIVGYCLVKFTYDFFLFKFCGEIIMLVINNDVGPVALSV